jgi:uncharacterized protein (TIGR00297 family)
VSSSIRRAGAFALVGTLSVLVPVIGRGTIVCFGAVAAAALFVVDDGVLFELFARPTDREDRTLYSLAAFSLAAAGLGILATLFGMGEAVFVASVFVLSYGHLTERLVRARRPSGAIPIVGFVVGGALAGSAGQVLVLLIDGSQAFGLGSALPTALFLATGGALLGALLRAVLFARDDPLVMLSIGLLLWLFTDLSVSVTAPEIAIAFALTAGLGTLAYGLGTASITGMLTGALLVYLTVVLGGYDWLAVLLAFFGLGSLTAKYRIDEKRNRGIAEPNDGARGSSNVLANAAVALVAVLAHAASPLLPVPALVFLFTFAGSLAAALADTLSSELGGLFDGPRLITTFERVSPGTNGGVTWQGELAGLLGTALVAAVTTLLFEGVSPIGGLLIAAAGVVGMTVDSLLGATIEYRLGNQGVNFFATLTAALVATAAALTFGFVA